MSIAQELPTFLQHTPGQKEATLIVAADNQKTGEIEASLAKAGFSKVSKALLFLKSIHLSERVYVVLTEDNAKDIYDICLQYPTGQITGFNSSKMKNIWVTPDYEKTSIVVVAQADLLKKLESEGQILRSVVGLTFQA